MTDTMTRATNSTAIDSDDARAARVAALQQRRAGTSGVGARSDEAVPVSSSRTAHERSSARPVVGAGSKVAAAGVGMATMFGLVAAMGYVGRASADPQPTPPAPAAPAQVVVVLHQPDATGTTLATGVPATLAPAAAVPAAPVAAAPAAPPAVTPAVVPVPASPQPIVLTAQPQVVQAPAAQAPAAQTNGSR